MVADYQSANVFVKGSGETTLYTELMHANLYVTDSNADGSQVL